MSRAFLFNSIAIVIFLLGTAFFINHFQLFPSIATTSQTQNALSAASISQSTSTTLTVAPSSVAATTTIVRPPAPKKAPSEAPVSVSTSTGDEIARIENPYSSPPESFTDINTQTRNAIVNILCEPEGYSSLNPISGSGVIIDPRGIILTNAHVAQYVLLSESPQIDLSCVIRTGSPARPAWSAVVLYIPPVWVSEHAGDISDQHPSGTGEHDYALLLITGSLNGAPLPAQFPSIPVDTRPAIGFPGDQVLIGSYPAEFLGGIGAQYDLYADTSVTTIKQLLTFGSGSPDVISLGGVIEAQSGSSGGAVVNAWGYLVGIIATTSSGTTTADRDLRAVALSYINTDIASQSGISLNSLLAGDPTDEVTQFNNTTAPELIQQYVNILSSNQASQ